MTRATVWVLPTSGSEYSFDIKDREPENHKRLKLDSNVIYFNHPEEPIDSEAGPSPLVIKHERFQGDPESTHVTVEHELLLNPGEGLRVHLADGAGYLRVKHYERK